MNILIVEEEIYLAQSIAGKLIDFGHECDIFAAVNDAMEQERRYDVVLQFFIERYPKEVA